MVVHVNHEYVYTDNEDGTHTGRCACGDTLAPEDHTYAEGDAEKTFYSSEEGHAEKCTKCGGHGEIQKHNEIKNGEDKEPTCEEEGLKAGLKCSDCGYEIQKDEKIEATGHNYETTYSQNEEHTKKCTNCKNTITEKCQYVYETLSGQQHHQICELCGHEKRDSKEYCTSDNTMMTSDENKHYYTCRFCGSQYKSFKHEFEENWQYTPYVSSSDMGTHFKVCKVCGYKANEEGHHFITESGYIPHTQTEKGGAGSTMICSDCGYKYVTIVREDDDFKHNFTYQQNEDKTKHTKTCSICGLTEIEDCTKKVKDNENGTHTYYCTICNGEDESVEHNYTTKYANNEQHTKICSDCGATVTENCNYKYESIGGLQHHQVCELCGHVKRGSEENCTRDQNNITSDENKHYYTCQNCGSQCGSFSHTFDKWETTAFYDEDGGTHAQVCKICGYKTQPVKHDYEQIKTEYKNHTQTELGGQWATVECKTCGYTESWWLRRDKEFNHQWSDGKCTICDLEATKNTDNLTEILKKADETEEPVTIYIDSENGAQVNLKGGKIPKNVTIEVVGKDALYIEDAVEIEGTVKGAIKVRGVSNGHTKGTLTIKKGATVDSITENNGDIIIESGANIDKLTEIGSNNSKGNTTIHVSTSEELLKAFKIQVKGNGNKTIKIDGDIDLSSNEISDIDGDLTIDEDAVITVKDGQDFGKNSNNVVINGILKVEGTLEDMTGVTGTGTIELANSDLNTNSSNFKNALKSSISKIQLDNSATISEIVNVKDTDLTITIADNVKLSNESSNELFKIENGKTLSIEGLGKTRSNSRGTLKGKEEKGNLVFENQGTLNLKNVKIDGYDAIKNYGAVTVENSEIISKNDGVTLHKDNASASLTNVTINAKRYGFSTNGSEESDMLGDIKIENCTINAEGNGVYLPAQGNVIIDGGSITGATAIEDKGANLTLTGDLTLIGTDTRGDNPEDMTSKLIEEHGKGTPYTGSYGNGTALIIMTQASYADGKTVNITIGDKVKFNDSQDKLKIEIVGIKDANNEKGANLVIDYASVTFDENSNCAPSKG